MKTLLTAAAALLALAACTTVPTGSTPNPIIPCDTGMKPCTNGDGSPK